MELNPGSASRWCTEPSCRNRIYSRNAPRLTFSDIGLAPNTSDAIRYQMEIWVATLICCEEWPNAHQTTRYIIGSMWPISPTLQKKVGIRISAPETIVKMAIIQAVKPPKTTSGSDPLYVFSLLATTTVPRNTKQPINAPTANRINPR